MKGKKVIFSVEKPEIVNLTVESLNKQEKKIEKNYSEIVDGSEMRCFTQITPPKILTSQPVPKFKSEVSIGVEPLGNINTSSKNQTGNFLPINLVTLLGGVALVGVIRCLKPGLFDPIFTFFDKKSKNNCKILTLKINCPFSVGNTIMLCKKNPHVKIGEIGIVIEKKYEPLKAVVDFSDPLINLCLSENSKNLIKIEQVAGEGLRIITTDKKK